MCTRALWPPVHVIHASDPSAAHFILKVDPWQLAHELHADLGTDCAKLPQTTAAKRAGALVIDEIDDAICATARRERLDRGERRSLSHVAVRCL
jgi:hypothetical protein